MHSLPMLVRLCSKSFKLNFSSTWINNFQMYKLSLEKAKEPEIKLPTFTGSWIEQGNPRVNIYFCFIDYDKAFDCVYHNKLLKILKEMNYQAIWPVSWETYMQSQEATVRTGHGTTDWFKTGTGIWQNCILSPCWFNLYAEGCACMLICFSHVWLFATLWTVAHQALLSWDSPGKNTRVNYYSLLQGIFPTQGLNLGLLYHRQTFLASESPGKPQEWRTMG